ncbi:YihY/virulence factor BrkB family protein [Candidatus Saccharibacteria bacterium]|nr:YihY/virulence factor BrkB family protein [Candidatus Saccharibacteria bacterium]
MIPTKKKTNPILMASAAIGAGLALLAFQPKQAVRQAQDEAIVQLGRASADSPRKLSLADWKDALKETKAALGNKNLPMLAAGVAYFSTLSFFPLLAAAVALLAIFIEPGQVNAFIGSIDQYVPQDIASLINTQLKNETGQQASNIALAIVAILISLYSASSATQNLIKATNETNEVDESRGFIKLKLISLALTLGALLAGFILIPILTVTPDFLMSIGMPEAWAIALPILRWVFVLVLITLALATFYRYGPDRKEPRWQWVSWGATAATVIWLIGTALFFFYVQNFGSFTESYGVFAGIIVLMTWLNLTSFIFLLGSEVNHRLERQAGAA